MVFIFFFIDNYDMKKQILDSAKGITILTFTSFVTFILFDIRYFFINYN